jgi:hypothetical protein
MKISRNINYPRLILVYGLVLTGALLQLNTHFGRADPVTNTLLLIPSVPILLLTLELKTIYQCTPRF